MHTYIHNHSTQTQGARVKILQGTNITTQNDKRSFNHASLWKNIFKENEC